MPVQINEIVVRVAVTQSNSSSAGGSATASGNQTTEAAVAEMVLDILKAKKER